MTQWQKPFASMVLTVPSNRGKGDYFRLGHGTDVHVRKPQMVEGLRGKKIVHVAVGALHCLAVTDTGQVCTDLYQLGSVKQHITEPLCSLIAVALFQTRASAAGVGIAIDSHCTSPGTYDLCCYAQ